MSEFAEWESFYVIVGAAAGALIGLQFVVMTLLADKPQLAVPDAGYAFATPTIVHFSVALLLSALLRAPWHGMTPVAVLWGFVGLGGIIYVAIIVRRVRMQRSYRPDLEDWSFHVVLPFAANAVLVLAAFAARSHEREALFGVAAATLLLLFIAIHNCWDTIAYQVFVRLREEKDTAS
jgi:hypothetical protein